MSKKAQVNIALRTHVSAGVWRETYFPAFSRDAIFVIIFFSFFLASVFVCKVEVCCTFWRFLLLYFLNFMTSVSLRLLFISRLFTSWLYFLFFSYLVKLIGICSVKFGANVNLIGVVSYNILIGTFFYMKILLLPTSDSFFLMNERVNLTNLIESR